MRLALVFAFSLALRLLLFVLFLMSMLATGQVEQRQTVEAFLPVFLSDDSNVVHHRSINATWISGSRIGQIAHRPVFARQADHDVQVAAAAAQRSVDVPPGDFAQRSRDAGEVPRSAGQGSWNTASANCKSTVLGRISQAHDAAEHMRITRLSGGLFYLSLLRDGSECKLDVHVGGDSVEIVARR